MSNPIRISLPPHFRMAIKTIGDNATRILAMLDDIEGQAQGIDSLALTEMIDTVEVATRLSRTEIHRALKNASYGTRR